GVWCCFEHGEAPFEDREFARTATKQLGGEPYAGCSTREWNPAGPKASRAQLAMKQARKVRHSKPGRPNPFAEFAATLKAYLPNFRDDNRQSLSESSPGPAKSVGHTQIFSDRSRSKCGSEPAREGCLTFNIGGADTPLSR